MHTGFTPRMALDTRNQQRAANQNTLIRNNNLTCDKHV